MEWYEKGWENGCKKKFRYRMWFRFDIFYLYFVVDRFIFVNLNGFKGIYIVYVFEINDFIYSWYVNCFILLDVVLYDYCI